MLINIPNPVKYLGVDYAQGNNQSIADNLAQGLINIGRAFLSNVPQGPFPVVSYTNPVTGVITVNGSIDVDVRAYGVVADGALIPGFRVSGAGNVGSVSSTVDTFTQADVNKQMCFHREFSSSLMAAYAMYVGRITSVEGPRNCTIVSSSCPTLTSTSPYASAVFGTDNGDAINAAVNALSLSPAGGTLQFPTGIMLAYKFKSARTNGGTYAVGAYVTRNTANGYYYKCIIAGTAGGSEPTYVDTYGATFVDGGVTWQCMGRTSIILPSGSCVRGRGRATGIPYGFVTTGSVVIGCGFEPTYSLLQIGNGSKGSQVQDITFDACTSFPCAIEVSKGSASSGVGTYCNNVTAMGGYSAAYRNGEGSTETLGCHFMARLQANAYACDTVGDANHIGGIMGGAGNATATLRARNITDDTKLQGIHFYKAGWGLDLTTLAGPNIRIESTAAGVCGGNIVGNTFDTALGSQIELYVSGGSAGGFSALAIAANQFYQPQEAFTTNTYSVIKVEATASAPAVSYSALSIMGNVAKGTPAGSQYASFINYALNAGTQVVGDVVIGNTIQSAQALYSGTAHTQSYTAGNAWRTFAGVTTVG
jgi:hypothetical protein